MSRPTEAPFSAQRSQTTETTVVPLFFGGVGVRLFDPLTVGAAFYVASGIGARYDNLPEFAGLDMMLELAVLEAALPVSYRITDELAVGAALRFAHAFLTADLPVDIGGMAGPLRLEMDISGNAFPGVLAGVLYRPLDTLAFGATYRSKMTIELEGTGTATHALFGGPLDVHSEWSTAHSFRVGGAWSPEPERLLVSLDVAYTLLDEAVNSLPVTLDFRDALAGTHIEQQIALEWQDSLAVLVGAEYMVTELFAARLGYHVATPGTPENYASPLAPPPGLVQTAHAGGGLRTESWRADVGGAYAFAGGADVEQGVNGPAGKYGGDYWLLGASLSYRH